MTELVVCLSGDEKHWSHIQRLIRDANWSKVYAITEKNCKERFMASKSIDFIIVDFANPAVEVIGELTKHLKNKFSDFEVALNLVSGTGKEHMIVLSALLKLGVGIRLVAVTKEGIKEL